MNSGALSLASDQESVFRDGIGERRRRGESGAAAAQLLAVRNELAIVPSFEFALRERTSRLAAFHHPSFAHVRGIERTTQPHQQLLVVSEETPGVRLSVLLSNIESRGLSLETNAALCLLRQLVNAIGALHESARDAAHGAIAPERLVVTPAGRLVVVEYVLGSALEQLLLSRDRYWTDLRVALPRMAGLPRFDHLTDITQIGVVGVALFLGRTLKDDEYPTKIADVITSAWAVSSRSSEPLQAPLRSWLERALQLDPRQSFPSAIEARVALDKAMAETGYDAAPASLEQFMARYHGVDRPAPVAAPPIASVPTPRPMPVAAVPTPPPPPSPIAAAPTPRPMPIPVTVVPPELDEPAPAPPMFGARAGAQEEPVRSGRRTWLALAAGVGAIVIAAGTIGATQLMKSSATKADATGTLVVNTEPTGARVMIDGTARGTTPLTVSLPVGSHKVELRGASGSRTLPVEIAAGSQASHFVELPKSASNVGQIRIRTEPAGAKVMLDGTPRGTAPTLVANLTPGEHTVVVESERGSATQTVTVEAGTTASVLVTVTAPAATDTAAATATSGWVAIGGKLPVQIFENGELLGSSETSKIMMATGRHELDLVNEALGYRVSRAVQITAGKVSTLALEPPAGNISVNAQPWAEVWIDGAKVGDTPIGNLSLPIGSHDIVFKHPELGEQHATAIVSLKEQTRVSADMRKR